ncbi:hypothetical protein BDZ89DRAFT_1055454, partial [Hymenopellis radicata]
MKIRADPMRTTLRDAGLLAKATEYDGGKRKRRKNDFTMVNKLAQAQAATIEAPFVYRYPPLLPPDMGTFQPLTTNGKRAADGEEEEEGSVKRQRMEEPEPEPEPEPAKDLELDKDKTLVEDEVETVAMDVQEVHRCIIFRIYANIRVDQRRRGRAGRGKSLPRAGENPFISLNESLPGKERSEEELVQLRDIALHLLTGGTDPVEYIASHRDDPKPLSYLIAKKSVPAPLWASLVHLNVPRKNGRRTACFERYCTTCNGLERACEYTCVGRPHSKCRECFDSTEELYCGRHESCQGDHFRAKEERERVEDPETLRATLLKEPLEKQREAKARVTKDVWVKVVQLGLDKTTEVDISEWDVSGRYASFPVRRVSRTNSHARIPLLAQTARVDDVHSPPSSCNPVTEVEEDNETPEDKVLYFKFAEFTTTKSFKNSDKTAWLLNMRGVIAVMSKAK